METIESKLPYRHRIRVKGLRVATALIRHRYTSADTDS